MLRDVITDQINKPVATFLYMLCLHATVQGSASQDMLAFCGKMKLYDVMVETYCHRD